MEVWLLIGVAGALGASLLVGLAVAAVLGRIGDEMSDLLETAVWDSAPLSRDRYAAPT